jgi:hypothetical protein
VAKKITPMAWPATTMSAITAAQASRESQLVRHCENALGAFTGVGQMKAEAISPPTASA